MASYKQPCLHCGAYIAPDARFCPACRSGSPFGYLCPSCLHPIEKGQLLCTGCGRPLHIDCPTCGKQTFVRETCGHCDGTLMAQCPNSRCGALQFFENTKCTACGKKMKPIRK